MPDNDSHVETPCTTKVFALTVSGSESIGSLCNLINTLCAGIETHPTPSVAIVHMDNLGHGVPWPGDITVQDVKRWERAVRRLEHTGAIIIIAAQNRCGGAALDLLLAGDYRIANPDFHLVLPVNQRQFWPGMVIHRLVQQVGVALARRIVLWRQVMDASACLSAEIIDELTEDVSAASNRMVSLIEGQDGRESAIRRRLLLEAVSSPYDEALGTHLAACDRELRRLQTNGPA